MTAYELGRAHATVQVLKKEALRRRPGPLLPHLLSRLGSLGVKGLYHLDPAMMRSISTRMRAQDIGAVGAGLGMGALGYMMQDKPQTPPPGGMPPGYMPPH